MGDDFAARLDADIKQSGLPVRRVADLAAIPHQTLSNWLKGMRPRWHPALVDDLRRLAQALGLDEWETERLLRAAGCLSRRALDSHTKEGRMSRTSRLPRGWFVAGSHPADYEMDREPGAGPAGAGAAFIRGGQGSQGFATLMQHFKADAYRGRRLRFSAAVRADDVDQWAGLWMRVDGPAERMLAFDNMMDRPISGTRDWQRHAVVLDVAEEADRIALGILMTGPGRAWIAEARVEPVGPDVPTTGGQSSLPDHPENLSFDE